MLKILLLRTVVVILGSLVNVAPVSTSISTVIRKVPIPVLFPCGPLPVTVLAAAGGPDPALLLGLVIPSTSASGLFRILGMAEASSFYTASSSGGKALTMAIVSTLTVVTRFTRSMM